MQWHDVVDKPLACQQEAWERRHAIRRARMAGASLSSLAKRTGLSRSRVGQLHERAIDDIECGRHSPIEYYLEPSKRVGGVEKMTPAEFRQRLHDAAYRDRRSSYEIEIDEMRWRNLEIEWSKAYWDCGISGEWHEEMANPPPTFLVYDPEHRCYLDSRLIF